MFLFRRKNSSTTLSTSSSSGTLTNKRQFTFAVQVESIENIPLYMQAPLSVDIYKLNSAINANQSQMTVKGRLFRKKKLVGSTPYKSVDSSSQKSNYMTTMEFLCNIPYDENLNCLVKGPVTSTSVFQPINEAVSNVEETSKTVLGEGKFLQIVVNKKLHTNNKVDFVNEMLVDLTHYCNLNSEYQCRISIPFELSRDVNVNINMVIFSTLGNQLTGRKSGSLDLSRPMSATNLKEMVNTSPSREENARSPSADVSPKVSPQINRVLINDLEDNPNPMSNNDRFNSPNNAYSNPNSLNGNNGSGGAQDFFKRRAELNSGRSRSGSSPISMQHTPHSPQYESSNINNSTNSNPYDSSPSIMDTGVVPNQAENIDSLRQENQQLKSVLQRAKVRFQEVISENSQLKERIKQLEDQMALLQTSPKPVTTPQKDLLDFF